MIKKHIMDSYQVKIGWKRMRKSENKNYRSITGSFLARIGRKRPRKTENKNYGSVSFLPGTK